MYRGGLVAWGCGYNLGYTDGVNADLDMIAIERPAKNQATGGIRGQEQATWLQNDRIWT
jgi:hypothetical protein